MIRTQVYLPKSLYQNVRLLAKKENRPAASLVRELLEDGLKKRSKKLNAGTALLRLAALGKKLKIKGPSDLSINHDKYLYEEE